MKRKYELTAGAGPLYRIRAVRNFGPVKAGELGGYVEKEENLSHEGQAWIFDDAVACGDARISGDAQLFGRARVCGHAKVGGKAKVGGDAVISGHAWVSCGAIINGDARIGGCSWLSGNAVMLGRRYETDSLIGGIDNENEQA